MADADIEDAELWMVKAVMLGYTLTKYRESVNVAVYCWGCSDGKREIFGDYPGILARLAVMERITTHRSIT